MGDMLSKRRATLRDVAKRSGVSVATVSRVLNSPLQVSVTTRERVQAAIDQLRFFPSPAARAINSGRTRLIGALVPTLDNAIFARFLDALQATLATRDLSLVVATTEGDPEAEAVKAQNLVECGAEGLVVSGLRRAEAFYVLVERAQVAVVATSFFDPGYKFPTIGYDNKRVSQTALEHLTTLGHRRIAVLHGPVENNDRTAARLSGLTLSAGLALSFHETELSVRGACAATAGLQDDLDSVTAILCLSDVLAMGALFELRRRGRIVPDEISVIGIDDLPSSEFVEPPLTTVRLEVSRMGETTGRAMADWIERGDMPSALHLDGELVVRQTTAPPSRPDR